MAGTDMYRPNATLLLCLCGCGLGFLWPMVRLSQARPGKPIWAFIVDGVAVAFPASIIVVSQSMPWMAAWSPYESALMIVSYIAWASFIVCALSLAVRPNKGRVGESMDGWVLNATGTSPLATRGGWMACIASLQAVGPLFGSILSSYTHSPWAIKLCLLTSPVTAPYAATSIDAATVSQWGGYHPAEFAAAGFPLVFAILLVPALGRSKSEY